MHFRFSKEGTCPRIGSGSRWGWKGMPATPAESMRQRRGRSGKDTAGIRGTAAESPKETPSFQASAPCRAHQ
ncbi:hypothetical protein OH687_38575 (plasmid) [Burkholderia anthina]|nr:hypothetical protein OH687_38575 [Burkholderia anthina]